jgi:hypothetical protein
MPTLDQNDVPCWWAHLPGQLMARTTEVVSPEITEDGVTMEEMSIVSSSVVTCPRHQYYQPDDDGELDGA